MTSSNSIGCWPSDETLMRQQKAGEIIDGETQFIPITTGLSFFGGGRADAGIVDQEIKPVDVLTHLFGEAAHFGKRRQVGRQKNCRAAARRDLFDDLLAPVAIAPMNQNAGTAISEPARHKPPNPIGRTGD